MASRAPSFPRGGTQHLRRLSLALAWAIPVAIGCGGSPSQVTGAAGNGAGGGGGAGTGGAAAGTGGAAAGTGGAAAGTGGAAAGTGGATGTGGSTGGRPVQTCVPPADQSQPPSMLSQTGCVSPSDPKTLASSVVPYEVNSPLWSDGADKRRGMALPAGGTIHVVNCAANPAECPAPRDRTDDGKWLLPTGTVMVKSFLFDGKFLETRLLVHFDETTWIGYTYRWDEAQTDATLVGTERDQVSFATGQRTVVWHFPSRRDCETCHVQGARFALGTETAQFNRVVGGVNQIDRLAAAGVFDAPVPKPYKAALVAPYPSDAGSPPPTATIEERAASYLHANCSFCHRPPQDVDCTSDPCMDFRFGLPLAERSLCNVDPSKNSLGITDAKTLVPGQPGRSLMWVRMTRPPDDDQGRHGRMPTIASYVVDQMAVDLIGSWITSITACP